MKNIIALIAMFCLCGCAMRSAIDGTREQTFEIWDAMQAASRQADGPYRLQLSLRVGEEGNTRRVTAVLWGNGSDALRLDVMAGVGAVIAKIAESGQNFVVFAPRENKAYYQDGQVKPLLKIGVPVPFDLSQLAMLLTGRFAQVFGEKALDSAMLANGYAAFELDSPPGGKLKVNGAGEPVFWQNGSWQLEITYDDANPYQPKTLTLLNQNGQKAIIAVKEREIVEKPFAPKQLQLELPGGVRRLPLSEYKQS